MHVAQTFINVTLRVLSNVGVLFLEKDNVSSTKTLIKHKAFARRMPLFSTMNLN